MIRSPGSLMAEDVTVRCRVRKCRRNKNCNGNDDDEPWKDNHLDSRKRGDNGNDNGNHSDEEDSRRRHSAAFVEMACTMRNWDGRSRSGGGTGNRTGSGSRKPNNSQSQHSSSSGGPELLFTPLHIRSVSTSLTSSWTTQPHDGPNNNPLSPPFATPPRAPRRRRAVSQGTLCRISPVSHDPLHFPSSSMPFSIPIEDIRLVHRTMQRVSPSKSNNSSTNTGFSVTTTRLFVQTQSILGTLELDCLSTNGYDIVLAFLQASLLPDCIRHIVVSPTLSPTSKRRDATHYQLNDDTAPNATATAVAKKDRAILKASSSSQSSVTSCLDVDTLQARHLHTRAEAETWPEKLSRRVGLVVNNISQMLLSTTAPPPVGASHNNAGTTAVSSRDASTAQDANNCSTSNRLLWCCCVGSEGTTAPGEASSLLSSSIVTTPTAANTSATTTRVSSSGGRAKSLPTTRSSSSPPTLPSPSSSPTPLSTAALPPQPPPMPPPIRFASNGSMGTAASMASAQRAASPAVVATTNVVDKPELELDDSATECSKSTHDGTITPQSTHRKRSNRTTAAAMFLRMPSGLSVEPPDPNDR